MSNFSLLAAVVVALISLSTITLAHANDNASRLRPAKIKMTAKHGSHQPLRQSYNSMRTDADPAAFWSSPNLYETARSPAQPGQW
jgi:hypothetical protein